MPKTISERLQEYGESLHQLLLDLPNHDAITDTLDYLLGGLYGLSRAHELHFRDRSGVHFSFYRGLLPRYALEISKGQEVNGIWRAGFYFNSAIQRIASAFDRFPQMLGAKMKVKGKQQKTYVKDRMKEVNPDDYAEWELLYDEVNDFKHSPEGTAAGRSVKMADALTAFEQVIGLLNRGTPKLIERYK